MIEPRSMSSSAATARDTVRRLEASRIREVANAGAGREDVIALWFGEPDQTTPAFVRDAAAAALAQGHTFYAPNLGIPPLRQAIADYLTALRRPVSAERIAVTASGVSALMLAAQCLVDPGDLIVTPTPHWPHLQEIPQIMGAGRRTVALELRAGVWSIDMDRLVESITPDVRAVIVNSPSNPTGWILESAEQEALLEHCRRLGVWIVADEVYDRMYYAGPKAPSFLDFAAEDDRLLVVNSFSKSWAMTGWRLGWIVAPAGMMDELAKLNEYNMSSAATFVQHAGIVAVREGEEFIKATVQRYTAARDLVHARLNDLPGVTAPLPGGALYCFFRIEGERDSLSLAKRILASTAVGLAPGVAFGPAGEGHLRLCFASSLERLNAALDRIGGFLSR